MRASRGFTLVEVLLALVLMGMLLSLAYGGLRAATRAADKGQAILEESGRVRMAHQFVRKQLNQMAYLAFSTDSADEEQAVFLGDAKKVRFVAPMPGYLGFGGPQVQELAVVPGDNGEMLVLSHALLQGFEEQKLYEREPIVLLEKIEFAEFSFLGRDEFGELSVLTNQWDEPELLPESVSLEIEFTEDVYIRWPLLIASVRVDSGVLQELLNGPGPNSRDITPIRDLINKRRSEN